MIFLPFAFAAVLLLGTWPAEAAEPRAATTIPVNGQPFSARPTGIDQDWTVHFEADRGLQTLKPSQFVLWGSYQDRSDGVQAVLTDGSVVVGDLIELGSDRLLVESRLWREAVLRRRSTHGFVVAPSLDALSRDRQIDRIRKNRAAKDKLLLANGDSLTGRLVLSEGQGGAGAFGVETLTLANEFNEQGTAIELGDLIAVRLGGVTPTTATARCLLGFRDGTLVKAAEVHHREKQMELVTASGDRLRATSDSFWKNLTLLQPLGAGVTYVSDLELNYKAFPFLQVEWPLGIDRNVLGGRLRSGGEVAFKGLGMHSTSRVVCDLDGAYGTFRSELALDDQAGREGSIVARVLLERRGQEGGRKWSLAYTSPIVRGGDAPISVSVDVRGASRMALLVEFADRGDVLDHANWLNARLIPD